VIFAVHTQNAGGLPRPIANTTHMIVAEFIFNQIFFTAITLGYQSVTSQFIPPLTPQVLVLVGKAGHCVLSEFHTGKKVMVMFSCYEYESKYCSFLVIDLSPAESTALINFTLIGYLIPYPLLLLYKQALFSLHMWFSVAFCTPDHYFLSA
jgi:hypothetical protein